MQPDGSEFLNTLDRIIVDRIAQALAKWEGSRKIDAMWKGNAERDKQINDLNKALNTQQNQIKGLSDALDTSIEQTNNALAQVRIHVEQVERDGNQMRKSAADAIQGVDDRLQKIEAKFLKTREDAGADNRKTLLEEFAAFLASGAPMPVATPVTLRDLWKPLDEESQERHNKATLLASLPLELTRWWHYKGGEYIRLFTMHRESDKVWMVAYRRADQSDGQIWTRPETEWNETVTDKDGARMRRFRRVE